MSILSNLQAVAKPAIESFYTDTCKIIVRKRIVDETTHVSKQKEEIIGVDIPCRLSFSSSPSTNGNDAPGKEQSIKLFLSPEIEVPEGSVIEVLKLGHKTKYHRSGTVARYVTHQEIILELEEKFA